MLIKKKRSLFKRKPPLELAAVEVPVPEVPEVVTTRKVEKETKVVYNIIEITNKGNKTHHQLEVASGSALEAEMDKQIADQNG